MFRLWVDPATSNKREIAAIQRKNDRIRQLLHALGGGPVERHALNDVLGWKDIQMRRAVCDARLQGHLVIWIDGKYKLAETLDEFETWKKRELFSRLGAFTTQLHKMDESAGAKWPSEQMLLIR